MNIKKNDNVIVISGSDKGKKGKVLTVLRDANKVVVEGINVRKVHAKKTKAKAGFIFEKSAPINASNVMLIDAQGGKPTRVSSKTVNGKKIRVGKSGQEIK
jgi:large subunit ribosomal protein L24